MRRILRVLRILRILASFWKTSLDAELEYRSNFVFAALASLGNIGGSIFTLMLFYRGGGDFPGWTFHQGLVVLGLFTVCSGIVATILSPNLSRIVTHVEQGTLDFVLLKPVDAQLQVSLRVLSPWGLPDLIFGVTLVSFGAVHSGVALPDVVLALFPLGAGVVLLYALWFLVASTAIWFVKIYNATEVLRGLLDAGRFPLAAYPAVYRFVFTFVVPVVFLTTVPAEALLGRGRPAFFAGGILAAVVAFVAARMFWRFSLRSYSGASG